MIGHEPPFHFDYEEIQPMKLLRLLVMLSALMVTSSSAMAQKLDFAEINNEELAMKDNPKQPGAHAMVLEWRSAVDDSTNSSMTYQRIKVFTDQGKKYGDIEIPYFKGYDSVKDLKARTVHPDGTVIPFNGQTIDKMVVKTRDFKYQAKTFSLPDIQPGSVIEYMYRTEGLRKSHNWTIQGNLYVKKASIHWQPFGKASNCLSFWMPHGENTVVNRGGYNLDVTDVPGLEEESFMPPVTIVKTRLQCWYTNIDPTFAVDKFWKEYSRIRFERENEYIGRRKAIENESVSLFAAGDSQEQKLQKIYDRVQKLRNLSFEDEKTKQEQKKEKLKDAHNVEDVLNNGYGNHPELNLLFAALARAAGFEANIIESSRRDESFFNKEWKDIELLDTYIIEVKLDGKYRYFDPGTKYCPFGLLRWRTSGVVGLRFNKDAVEWVTTPDIDAVDAQRKRKADFKFEDGELKGKVTVTYFNQWAFSHRLNSLNEDDTEQKKSMEDEAKGWFPQGTTVKMLKITNAKETKEPFQVEYEVEMPGVGSTVGSKVLMPLAVFQGNDTNPLRHEKRKFPVYFHYAYSEIDEISIELPPELEVDSMPKSKRITDEVGVYESAYGHGNNNVSMKRTMAISGFYYPVKYYSNLRGYFDKVASADQDNVVLKEKK